MYKRFIYVACFALVLDLVLTNATNAVDPNLVGWWKFDETSGTTAYDSSGNGYNGTLGGNPQWVAGYRESALQFNPADGNDYVELDIGSLIPTLDECTFSIWVNWSGRPNTVVGGWQRIFDFGTSIANYIYLCPSTGTANAAMSVAITANNFRWDVVDASTGALPTGWHHIAVTISKSSRIMILYLDGDVVGSKTGCANSVSNLGNTTTNWLGRSQYYSLPEYGPYFKGSLDDFRIYNRILSQAEIKNEAELDDIGFAEITGTETPIIAIATNKNTGEAIGILTNKNAEGKPIEVTGVVYLSEQGEGSMVEVGVDGLPIYFADFLGNRVIFENYTDNSVDISRYNSIGELIEGPYKANVDPAKLIEIKELFTTITSSVESVQLSTLSVSTRCKSRENLIIFLKWGSVTLNWVSCTVNAYFGNILGALKSCISALFSTISALTPEKGDDLISYLLDARSCGSGDVFGCFATLADMLGLKIGGCAEIAGNWNYYSTETSTFITDGIVERNTVDFSGIITIEQNVCDIKLESPQLRCDRIGTIERNNIYVSGIAVQGEGINFTQNIYTAEGTICGDEINLNGTGRAAGTFYDEDGFHSFSCTGQNSMILTRSNSESVLEMLKEKEAFREHSVIFMNDSMKILTKISPKSIK